MSDSYFAQWAKDGRLATMALVVVFVTWVLFQIFVEPLERPSFLDQMLWTIMGGWLTNIALAVGSGVNGKDKSDKEDK
jgi:membrane-associated PAP2 superfamily phosphatase